MIPYTYINKSEDYFKNKRKARAYFLESNKEEVFYEINFDLDMSKIVLSDVDKIDFLLSPVDSKELSVIQSSRPPGSSLPVNSLSAVSQAMTSFQADLTGYLVGKSQVKKLFVTSISPIKFIDLERYRNNFKGTAVDKFGLISNITTFSFQKNKLTSLPELDDMSIESAQRKMYEKIEKGLFEGIPLSKTINFEKIRRKKAVKRHVITDESNLQNKRTSQNLFQKSNTQENLIIDLKNAKDFVEKSKNAKSYSSIRTVSFILRIKRKNLSNINESSCKIIFEAKDKNENILDSNSIEINLKRDESISKISLEGINASISDGVMTLSKQGKQKVAFNLYMKTAKKGIPFYEMERDHVGNILIPSNFNSHKVKLVDSLSNSRTAGLTKSYLRICSKKNPTFFRITPIFKLGNERLELDNMFETGFKPKETFNNFYVPLCVLNITRHGKPCAKILIDVEKIPKKYKKIKVLKKDLTRALYSSYKNTKDIFNKENEVVSFIRTGNDFLEDTDAKGRYFSEFTNDNLDNDFLTVFDFNIENDKMYEYRLELCEKIKTSNRTLSTSSFQEKIEKRDRIVIITLGEVKRTSNNVFLSFTATVSESDAEKAFKSLLGNKYDLLKNTLEDIKEITTNAISVKVDKICIEDGTIETVDYLSSLDSLNSQAEDANTNTNNYTFQYSDTEIEKNKNYVYKLTPCLKPISELLSGINEEIRTRSSNPKHLFKNFKQYKYIGIRKKLLDIDTNILYNLANKLANVSKGKIIDNETSAGLSDDNIFSLSSTGDISYAYCLKRTRRAADTSKGFDEINLLSADVFKNKKMKDIGVYSDINCKILLHFLCEFNKSIDYCAIFVKNKNIIEHVCNMNVSSKHILRKTKFKLLIELENYKDMTHFLMVPVKFDGTLLRMSKIASLKL